MDTQYTLWKIKPGMRKVWENWCREVMEKHQAEGAETLVEEDLIREQNFIFGAGDESYVLYLHTPLPGKTKKPFNPQRALNQKHFKIFHECLERVTPKVLGYDLQTDYKFLSE